MSGDTNIKYLDDCGARKMWHISSCWIFNCAFLR
jgi:hypothetical protein